ncbi:MAG: DNA polymerase IV [Thalassotalea sp.]
MRKIIHVDMDCFYAAVEMRDFPQYQKIPILVGFDGPRSVVCTCNYLAREYGVKSAMPIARAKQLCPDITIVNARMSVYKAASDHIREIFSRYTDKIEPLSLDEAYLDVTDSESCSGSATLIAEEIRQTIFNELNLTASAGVAPNKFIAKIASDENKPNGSCIVGPEQVTAFVENLPLKKIPGIGPKTAKRLADHQFVTCADIRAADVEQLKPLLGKNADNIYLRAFGIDNREVISNRERKSLGIERTFGQDISDINACEQVIENLYEKLKERYTACQSKTIVKQGVKVKFADFQQTTIEQQSGEFDLSVFKSLFIKAYQRAKGRDIRLLGLSLGFKENKVTDSNNVMAELQLVLDF